MAGAATSMSQPTRPVRSARNVGGFTLVEMTATMAIVALTAGLMMAATPGTGRAGLKAVTMQAMALLRRERENAILTRRDRGVVLDGPQRLLIGDSGSTVVVPRDVTVDLLGVADPSSGRLPVTMFSPNGDSTGAVLRFSREAMEYEIRVNWYTGGISFKTD